MTFHIHIWLELVETDPNEELVNNIRLWFSGNFSFDSDSTNSSRLCETSLWSLQPVLENFSLLFNSNANGWCAVWLYFTNLFLFDKFSLLSLKWFWASASLFLTQFVNIWNFKKDWIYGCNFLETNIFFLQSCFFLLRRFSYERRITLKRYSFIGSINLPQIFLEKKLLESWILKDGTPCFILNIKVVKLSGENSKNWENRRNNKVNS